MNDIENILDEDFLFYLGFTSYYTHRIKECADKMLMQQWLQVLCGETAKTVDQKRCRNIFLSNLILSMQEGKLHEPFSLNPSEIDMTNPEKYFPAIQSEIKTPTWLDETAGTLDESGSKGRADGRTYVATQSFPDGRGAFAYVAVSLADQEPMWLGGGEGAFDEQMKFKFNEMVPPQHEMESILAKRRDPKLRQRVLTFYDVLLQNIADELDEKIKAEDNTSINKVMDQMIADLKAKGQYEEFDKMCAETRRIELLLRLFAKTKKRRDRVAKREEVLDEVDATLRASFFESTMMGEEDKYELPSAMWEYAINRPLNKKNMDSIQEKYPPVVVEMFLELLSDQKEQIAMRMQRRHANIVAQMKRDLKKEGEKLKKMVETARISCDEISEVLLAVRKAHQAMKDSYTARDNRKKGGETALTKLYNEMRAALVDTQILVEQEAERGRVLTEQLNALNTQNEMYAEVTNCSIVKTEETNMELMKNIKKLQAAIKQYENRLKQIQMMRDGALKAKQMFIF